MKIVLKIIGIILVTAVSITLNSIETSNTINPSSVKNKEIIGLEKSLSYPIQFPNLFFMFTTGLE